ncbi:uncharacterized protein LOC124295045 [Neodiprion lecontei]|uniref:Uncharacterized protein LOC124295045 n=1 Tax=Neodiprion lecontei TaxID=441921 RepID=A0ABM3GFM9_NEOLC|nr:uncharacterized protein LOC124295045 [Neodiprion lecontei]
MVRVKSIGAVAKAPAGTSSPCGRGMLKERHYGDIVQGTGRPRLRGRYNCSITSAVFDSKAGLVLNDNLMESPLMLGIRSVRVNVVLHNVRRNVFEPLERFGDVNFALVRNSGTLEIPRSKCYEVADSYETQNWKTRITKMTIADEKRELDSKLKNNSRILAETDESDDDGLAEVNPESEVIDETYQREAVLRRLAEIERRGETRILLWNRW